MSADEFVDLDEDIYILEAVGEEMISYADGVLRSAAVEIESRLAYSVSAEQITYASEHTGFLKFYPDPKQVSVLRMLLADGTLREIQKLDSELLQELRDHWTKLRFGQSDLKESEADRLKFGKILMECSNTAFEAMDMELIPKPGEDSKYWDRMEEIAGSLKGMNAARHLFL